MASATGTRAGGPAVGLRGPLGAPPGRFSHGRSVLAAHFTLRSALPKPSSPCAQLDLESPLPMSHLIRPLTCLHGPGPGFSLGNETCAGPSGSTCSGWHRESQFQRRALSGWGCISAPRGSWSRRTCRPPLTARPPAPGQPRAW